MYRSDMESQSVGQPIRGFSSAAGSCAKVSRLLPILYPHPSSSSSLEPPVVREVRADEAQDSSAQELHPLVRLLVYSVYYKIQSLEFSNHDDIVRGCQKAKFQPSCRSLKRNANIVETDWSAR